MALRCGTGACAASCIGALHLFGDRNDAYMPCMQDRPFDRQLRIASYNIRKARGLDGRRDPVRIADVINGLDADVVALQEADLRMGDRPAALTSEMIAAHTDFAVAPLAANAVSLGWHGNAVLIRKGQHITRTEHITLPGFEPRGAVAVTLASGLTVVGVHLGLLRPSRRRQLAVIRDYLAGRTNVVVTGDMNEWAKTRGLEALALDYTVHAPGPSFPAARPLAALDRLALSHDLHLVGAGVAQGALARRASDHLPIWGDVAFAGQAGALEEIEV